MSKPSKNAAIHKPRKAKTDLRSTRVTKRSPKRTSKSARIVEMLARPSGASIQELATAAEWQAHSVRGFLSGTLKKKRGLAVRSNVVDGTRRYHLEPAGSGQ